MDTAYEIVVFGATSFVGRLLCEYLAAHAETAGGIRWAAAGRSPAKLETLRTELGLADLPLIVADATDENALREMCAQTRVVVSTVGPYALYGEPLIAACAESGTDYCDLTGELQWIRRMIDGYEERAVESGARLVNCCGFDSIPSDLGVHVLQAESMSQYGAPCVRVKMRVRAMRGAFSGGTVASMLNAVEEISRDPQLRRQLANPYSLCPPDHAFTVRQPNVTAPRFDEDFGAWVAPFVMAAINTRVVHRTNALSGAAYGADFRYDEAMLTGRGFGGRLRSWGTAGGLGAFGVAAAIPPTRWLMKRLVLPAPGEGPDAQQRERGFFDLRFRGVTADGRPIRATVTGDRDPGYGSTAKMLGQAALCLARDVDRDVAGGFWTPATLFGDTLVTRLRDHAGLTFETSAAS